MPGFFRRNKSAVKTLNQKLNAAFFNRKNWESEPDNMSVSWLYKFNRSSDTEEKILKFLEAKDSPFQVSISHTSTKTLIRVATDVHSMQTLLALTEGQSAFNDKLNKKFYDKHNWAPLDGNEHMQFSIKAYDIADQNILSHFLDVKNLAFNVQVNSKKDYDVLTVKAKREDIAKLLSLAPSALAIAERNYHPYDIARLDNIIEKALLGANYHKASHRAGEVNIFYSMSQEEKLLKEKLDSRIKDFFEEQGIDYIGYGANDILSIVLKDSELAKFQNRPSLIRAA